MIGSLISEYPEYSLISDRDSARNCFLMILLFLKSLFLTGWLYANVIIHLSVGESPEYPGLVLTKQVDSTFRAL